MKKIEMKIQRSKNDCNKCTKIEKKNLIRCEMYHWNFTKKEQVLKKIAKKYKKVLELNEFGW